MKNSKTRTPLMDFNDEGRPVYLRKPTFRENLELFPAALAWSFVAAFILVGRMWVYAWYHLIKRTC